MRYATVRYTQAPRGGKRCQNPWSFQGAWGAAAGGLDTTVNEAVNDRGRTRQIARKAEYVDDDFEVAPSSFFDDHAGRGVAPPTGEDVCDFTHW